VTGSRTIQVRKRDGSQEGFDVLKLAASMWWGIRRAGGRYQHARDLSDAIRLHLLRGKRQWITSAALFEMAIKVLRRVRMPDAAEVLETHRLWRRRKRSGFMVHHGDGRMTFWDKTWLSDHVCRSWRLSPTTARIVAGYVEADLLARPALVVTREHVLDRMNRCVAACGLADAVPIEKEPARA
jgi:ATP cone domain-containing protein